jgi:hypothetical protein
MNETKTDNSKVNENLLNEVKVLNKQNKELLALNIDLREQLFIHGVSNSFTFEQVENLLKTQRTNCVVAVMKYITDDEILEKISDAPMYDYKKALNKK